MRCVILHTLATNKLRGSGTCIFPRLHLTLSWVPVVSRSRFSLSFVRYVYGRDDNLTYASVNTESQPQIGRIRKPNGKLGGLAFESVCSYIITIYHVNLYTGTTGSDVKQNVLKKNSIANRRKLKLLGICE